MLPAHRGTLRSLGNNMNKRYVQFLVIVCLITAISTSSLGQVLPFHHYTSKDGLASSWVTTMMQDSRGYIWIGTAEGISVFDGITFRNYRVQDGLPFNFVYDIIESKKHTGTIWIATGDGLAEYQNDKFTIYHTLNPQFFTKDPKTYQEPDIILSLT